MYMLRLRPHIRNGRFRARPLLSQPALHRALPLLVTFCVVLSLLSLSSCATPQGWCPLRSKSKPPGVLLEPDGPGAYEWDTQSAFDPVRQYGAAVKTPAQLCAAFPTHLLNDIQPVLKTGHAVSAHPPNRRPPPNTASAWALVFPLHAQPRTSRLADMLRSTRS